MVRTRFIKRCFRALSFDCGAFYRSYNMLPSWKPSTRPIQWCIYCDTVYLICTNFFLKQFWLEYLCRLTQHNRSCRLFYKSILKFFLSSTAPYILEHILKIYQLSARICRAFLYWIILLEPTWITEVWLFHFSQLMIASHECVTEILCIYYR